MISIVETPQFAAKADKILSAAEKDDLFDFIARNPKAGDIIPGTGGVRKMRFAVQGKGKRGGVRVIYYYYNDRNPVLLFTVFGKNEKSDLREKEENILYRIVQEIKKEMRS
jgi:mRNA-degrading endonuclease RelE of RelBE toxin-antitoxin system